MNNFETKDSGKRQEYASGMRRDIQDGKPRYDLTFQPLFKRWAELMMRGAIKYGENNWTLANSIQELQRFRASAYRHFFQWINDEASEEDHAAAVLFNIACIEYMKEKLGVDVFGRKWIPSPTATRYEVSNSGDVRRIEDKKIMKQWENCWGYSMVSVSGAPRKHFQVHRLVLEAFIGPSPLQVNHKDGIKSNNSLYNLEYVTASENNKHAFATGIRRSKPINTKIDYKTAEEIRLRVDAGEKQKDLAKEFGLAVSTINGIVKNRCWLHDYED